MGCYLLAEQLICWLGFAANFKTADAAAKKGLCGISAGKHTARHEKGQVQLRFGLWDSTTMLFKENKRLPD